jgi:hypothetical protein
MSKADPIKLSGYAILVVGIDKVLGNFYKQRYGKRHAYNQAY